MILYQNLHLIVNVFGRNYCTNANLVQCHFDICSILADNVKQIDNVFPYFLHAFTFSASMLSFVQSPTTLVIRPMPSTSQITSSPFFKKLGGTKPIPTPAGVPVAMMVPAFKVMP